MSQSGDQFIFFDDEKQHLRHAARIDDQQERRPREDLVGAETRGYESLRRDGDGENGGAQAPRLHGFPFDDADDHDRDVDQEDDDAVDPRNQRAS